MPFFKSMRFGIAMFGTDRLIDQQYMTGLKNVIHSTFFYQSSWLRRFDVEQ
jgi:hypothetical protein